MRFDNFHCLGDGMSDVGVARSEPSQDQELELVCDVLDWEVIESIEANWSARWDTEPASRED